MLKVLPDVVSARQAGIKVVVEPRVFRAKAVVEFLAIVALALVPLSECATAIHVALPGGISSNGDRSNCSGEEGSSRDHCKIDC